MFMIPRATNNLIIEPVGGGVTTAGGSSQEYQAPYQPANEDSGATDNRNIRNAPPPLPDTGVTTNKSTGSSPRPFLDAGGSANVNDRAYGAVFGQHYGTNPFIDTEDDNLSTFAMDVDTASYSIMRRFLTDGVMPLPDLVRTEEFINYFDYDYPPPQDGEAFAIHLEGSRSPFGSDNHHLLKVGLQARTIGTEQDREPITVVLTIDTSGSMVGNGMVGNSRLELARQSALILVEELRPEDEVAIVTYGEEARTILKPTSVENTEQVIYTLHNMPTGGTTYAAAGIQEAYNVAARSIRPGRTVRVILMSDGVANVGRTGPDSILELVRSEVDRGIYLTTIGFGMGNYNDVLMEQLANNGNGTYHYVDNIQEARRILSQNLIGLLHNIADDAKIQVEFNPESVKSFRLLGYENRRLADEEFRQDDVDAGEVGAGQNVTALYEIKLMETEDATSPPNPIATVRIRYRDPDTRETLETARELHWADMKDSPDDTSPAFRLAAGVAEFAEILRGSYWAQDGSLKDVQSWIDQLVEDSYQDNEDVVDLALLLDTAARIDY